KPAKSLVTQQWIEETFIPVVQQRGAAVIKARGASSAASAASAAIDHVHSWLHGTGAGDWVSMAVPSDGSYGIAAGVIYSYPVTQVGGIITLLFIAAVLFLAYRRLSLLTFTVTFTVLLFAYTLLGAPAGIWKGFLALLLAGLWLLNVRTLRKALLTRPFLKTYL